LLPNMDNMAISGNKLVDAVAAQLSQKLPPGWRIASTAPGRSLQGVDAVMRIRGPGSNTASVRVTARRRLEPKDLDFMPQSLRPVRDIPVAVVAPFLSPRTRERLKALGFQYADLTGNIRLSLSKPALYVETQGADKNPAPAARERRSLKGAKAGRLIRALCDFRPPIGVRELAKRAAVDAGYVSRILDFLDKEALVVRKQRGPITEVDWPALLRRWSQEYSPFQPDRIRWFLAARGLPQGIERLRTRSSRYAITGSWAASQLAPVAPPRLLMCYCDEASDLAQGLDLRPADAAASNVALVTPFDPVVYDRTSEKAGIVLAASSQVVADLLTAPGRGPSEAETLIDWMRENENAWRT
jgi:hypothetical protein